MAAVFENAVSAQHVVHTACRRHWIHQSDYPQNSHERYQCCVSGKTLTCAMKKSNRWFRCLDQEHFSPCSILGSRHCDGLEKKMGQPTSALTMGTRSHEMKDVHPQSHPEKIFSTIDLMAGYWKTPKKEEDKFRTNLQTRSSQTCK